jgi:hypothetical protein
MNPFFSYFGSRWRLSKLYRPPEYDIIIEPFAGAAGYSTFYEGKKVLLFDTYPKVVETWKFLIETARSPKKQEDFSKLPAPIGGFTKNNPIPESLEIGARHLIGWWETESQTSPSPYQFSKSRGGNWTEMKRDKLLSQLPKIINWEIENLSFQNIPNMKATWHIDPPYQKAGTRYIHNKIDYDVLADWSKSRTGQVMVCEQEPAKWLDFKHLKLTNNASNKKYQEVVWYNHDKTIISEYKKYINFGWTIEEIAEDKNSSVEEIKKVLECLTGVEN